MDAIDATHKQALANGTVLPPSRQGNTHPVPRQQKLIVDRQRALSGTKAIPRDQGRTPALDLGVFIDLERWGDSGPTKI
jgi:hypothetical protein